MSYNPTEKAHTPIAWWMQEIPRCDGLEIHPVCDVKWDDETMGKRPFNDPEERETWYEVCQPDEAHFWSVYGHLKEGGIECFEDFKTKAEAHAFAEKLLATYPHLREYGI